MDASPPQDNEDGDNRRGGPWPQGSPVGIKRPPPLAEVSDSAASSRTSQSLTPPKSPPFDGPEGRPRQTRRLGPGTGGGDPRGWHEQELPRGHRQERQQRDRPPPPPRHPRAPPRVLTAEEQRRLRERRLELNRMTARIRRRKKRALVQELESERSTLRRENRSLMAENRSLRAELREMGEDVDPDPMWSDLGDSSEEGEGEGKCPEDSRGSEEEEAEFGPSQSPSAAASLPSLPQQEDSMRVDSIQGTLTQGGQDSQLWQADPMRVDPIQGNPIQEYPAQGSPIQRHPMQVNPVQSQPMQPHPNPDLQGSQGSANIQGNPAQAHPNPGNPIQGHPSLVVGPLAARVGAQTVPSLAPPGPSLQDRALQAQLLLLQLAAASMAPGRPAPTPPAPTPTPTTPPDLGLLAALVGLLLPQAVNPAAAATAAAAPMVSPSLQRQEPSRMLVATALLGLLPGDSSAGGGPQGTPGMAPTQQPLLPMNAAEQQLSQPGRQEHPAAAQGHMALSLPPIHQDNPAAAAQAQMMAGLLSGTQVATAAQIQVSAALLQQWQMTQQQVAQRQMTPSQMQSDPRQERQRERRNN